MKFSPLPIARPQLIFVLSFLISVCSFPDVSGQSVGKFYEVTEDRKEIDSLGSFQFIDRVAALDESAYTRLDKFIRYFNDSVFAGKKVEIMISPLNSSEKIQTSLCTSRLNLIVGYLMSKTKLKSTDLTWGCVPGTDGSPQRGFVSFTKKPTVQKQLVKALSDAMTIDTPPKFNRWRSTLDNYVWENFSCGGKKQGEIIISIKFTIKVDGYVRKGSVSFIRNGEAMSDGCRARLIKILEKSPQWSPAHSTKLDSDMESGAILNIHF